MHRAAYSRRQFLQAAALSAGLALTPGRLSGATPTRRHNVLFIAVDDLRPDLGCYGNDFVKTPHIDRLAARGMLFERAYCQQAICMASRASLLSGYRPDVGEIYRNQPLYEHVPDAYSLNRHFKANGYATKSIGKIYHYGKDDQVGWTHGDHDPKGDWVGRGYLSPAAQALARAHDEKYPNALRRGMGPAFERADVPDNAYADGRIADEAITSLEQFGDAPFFLGVGFKKPHLPFNAPAQYWDLYDANAIPLADNPYAPLDSPELGHTAWGELRGYAGVPRSGPMPDELARRLIHGYYACISYVDAQIGRVLDALERLELAQNTVIVLWGDHGWKLGEHGMWCKHTNFEVDVHAPLIFRAPGQPEGQRTRALVELVDVYPTLCDLCHLDKPGHLQGTSAAPLFTEPDRPWKTAAFSQYPRGRFMGYSMRTDTHRYTEWHAPRQEEVVARELYDHRSDAAENRNVVDLAENARLVKALARQLHRGYEAARPRMPMAYR